MGALRLRLRLPSGQTTVEATTFGELADHVNAALGENSSSAWSLLTGYPPTLLGKCEPGEELADKMRSGETIVVKLAERAAVGVPAPALEPTPAPTPAPLPVQPVPHRPALAALTAADEDEGLRAALAASLGQPTPAAPPYEDEDAQLRAALAASLGQDVAPTAGAQPSAQGDGERLIRRVIPADNSCLFAAVAHAHGGAAGRRERADGLRRVVADAVMADGERYSEAVLGKPPYEYCEWILNAEHWGGGIELAVLSDHFGTEICAFVCHRGASHLWPCPPDPADSRR